MQVETLTRERTALVSAAASRALMLERHERAADLFARMTLARRNLAAHLDGRTEPPSMDEAKHAEVRLEAKHAQVRLEDKHAQVRLEAKHSQVRLEAKHAQLRAFSYV